MTERHIYPLNDERSAFRELIDALELAAARAREIAHHRGQQGWMRIDENIMQIRKLVIAYAESAERESGPLPPAMRIN